MVQKKLVLFGAGKIGRSFIGPLFSRSGYQVIFIDVDQRIINELNHRKKYKVVIKSEHEEQFEVRNVCGIYANDRESVINAIAQCSLMATCVGKNALPKVLPLISQGIEKRFAERPNFPLDIILAENIRDACTLMKEGLKILLDEEFLIDSYVGLIETSIGKMVPIMPKEIEEKDPLLVFAEPYNTLILDKNGFKNPIPNVVGLSPKENIKAWVDRKLFIHNLGHATTAYLGNIEHPSAIFLYEVLSDNKLKAKVRNTMLQAADILLKKYPGEFTQEMLIEHIDDLIGRFQNRALGDTIFRVGCDLQRKLGAEDRLAGAIHLAREFKLPCDLILKALIYGCYFKATDQNGMMFPPDIAFIKLLSSGIDNVLRDICGFNEISDYMLFKKAAKVEKVLKRAKNISKKLGTFEFE
ncbi:MAG: mannitol-1-phosphate 5-dehydrogenase [Bacteroidia bacterium]|nr:mannitol-1-phosphate 5-dehydrogenase [Bacteroidia bacterium]